MNKKLSLILLIFFLAGCRLFEEKSEVIKQQKFNNLVEGKIENISDAVDLFPKSVNDIYKRSEYIISIVKNDLGNFFEIERDKRTFENTAYVYDKAKAKLGIVLNAVKILEMVSPNKEIRDACHEIALKLQRFEIDVFSNLQIYRAFKDYVELNAKNEKLNNEEKYYLEELMRNFKREGFDLPEKDFEVIKNLKKQIADLGLEFDKNINIDNSFIKASIDELKGVDPYIIKNLKKDGDKYILKCDYPTYHEVMENCFVPETRKRFYLAFTNRAYPENIEILNLLISKRDELGKKLKFKSFAEFSIDSEMAKTPSRVREFLDSLVNKAKEKTKQEYEKLKKELPEDVQLSKNEKFMPWDFIYIKEYYKKKNFDIDEREIAKYFPVQNVLEKAFELYQKFLGLKFKIVETDNLWHKDVMTIQVYDKESDDFRGTLFLDLYPRENKYSHACELTVVLTTKSKDHETGQYDKVPAVVVIIANFPKATKDKPALLKFSDVETFFHELGHAMHEILGRTEMNKFSGTNVKLDFAETPSQTFEEWLWNKDILRMLTRHYETGKPLPDELIDKKISLKKFDSGYFVTRLCFSSFVSLDYFAPGANKNTDKIKKELHDKYIKHIAYDPKNHFQASFTHLFEYDARYYVYLWSLVFALDIFEDIKENGLLSYKKIGKKFREEILAKGGSVDPNLILKNFLGREPNQDAFLKEYGIIDEAK